MNIPEILVANGTGIILVAFLFLLRVRNSETKQTGAVLYDGMLAVTLVALVTETISFLIDGQPFRGCHTLVVLTNTLCTGSTVLVGFLWCLFVDFRIYRSTRRLHRKILTLGIPLLLVQLLMVINLFGTGLIFHVSAENVYSRGPLNFLLYATLFLYFAESIYRVTRSKQTGITIEFFPVFYFVIPCILGTVVQGRFYGLSTGWLAAAVAMVFIHIQLQNFNTFVDETSGLFNRKYMNFYLEKAHKTNPRQLYGIMMDVNCFKEINDTYGHGAGDRAIQEIGHILSGALVANSVAIRISGDEFMVLIRHGSEEILNKVCAAIEQRVQRYNAAAPAGSFQLSFSTGVAKYEGGSVEKFLVELDERMYAEKRAFHAARNGHAVPEQGNAPSISE